MSKGESMSWSEYVKRMYNVSAKQIQPDKSLESQSNNSSELLAEKYSSAFSVETNDRNLDKIKQLEKAGLIERVQAQDDSESSSAIYYKLTKKWYLNAANIKAGNLRG